MNHKFKIGEVVRISLGANKDFYKKNKHWIGIVKAYGYTKEAAKLYKDEPLAPTDIVQVIWPIESNLSLHWSSSSLIKARACDKNGNANV